MLSNILSVISDTFWAILLTVAGLILLFAPYEKAQKIFPNLIKSKKAVKILGAVVALCGIIMIVLLATLL